MQHSAGIAVTRGQDWEPTHILAAVAAAIARTVTVTSARWPELAVEDATDRSGARVLWTDTYDIWLLHWPRGTSVTPHDHGPSAGAFCLVRGALAEVRWQQGSRSTRVVSLGETVTIDSGVVHDVIGLVDGSLSVHVYSPPLSEMGFYDADGIALIRRQLVALGEEPFGLAAQVRSADPVVV